MFRAFIFELLTFKRQTLVFDRSYDDVKFSTSGLYGVIVDVSYDAFVVRREVIRLGSHETAGAYRTR